jgi:rubrerythrin
VSDGPDDLTPGYRFRRRGTSSYRGVLRRPAGSEAWACPHDHMSPGKAKLCAEAELENRRQAAQSVIVLLRCEPCDRWWPAGAAGACPVCGVPMERLKLVVAGRSPAVDGGNRQH